MRFWQQLFERRLLATPSTGFLEAFSGGPTSSGMAVTPESAAAVPGVFSCLQVLSQDVARTPIKFRRLVDNDTY